VHWCGNIDPGFGRPDRRDPQHLGAIALHREILWQA
jgi:hypothetical protein